MNIALISWDYTGQAYAMRLLGTLLDASGNTVRIIIAKSWMEIDHGSLDAFSKQRKYDGLARLLDRVNLVCLSFLSIHMDEARELSAWLRQTKPDAVILAGGVHASVKPQEVMAFCDYVCIGEAEKALPAFVEAMSEGRNPSSIPGIHAPGNGATDNAIDIFAPGAFGEPLEDLSANPPAKLFLDRTWFFDPWAGEWRLRDADHFFMLDSKGRPRNSYYLFPDRGCVGNCTYCVVPR